MNMNMQGTMEKKAPLSRKERKEALKNRHEERIKKWEEELSCFSSGVTSEGEVKSKLEMFVNLEMRTNPSYKEEILRSFSEFKKGKEEEFQKITQKSEEYIKKVYSQVLTMGEELSDSRDKSVEDVLQSMYAFIYDLPHYVSPMVRRVMENKVTEGALTHLILYRSEKGKIRELIEFFKEMESRLPRCKTYLSYMGWLEVLKGGYLTKVGSMDSLFDKSGSPILMSSSLGKVESLTRFY